MRWMMALREGLLSGRRGALSTGLFYVEALLMSALALAPFGAGLHRVLDGSPAAGSLATGAGLDLLAELGLNQPGFWAAGFAAVPWALLAHLSLGLALVAGATGLAAAGSGLGPWRTFWGKAREFFLPFAGLFALNLLLWGIVALVPFLALAGLGKAFKGTDSPAVFWGMAGGWIAVAALLLALFKGSLGFGQARRVIEGSSEGLGRCFLRGAGFSLRHLGASLGFFALFGALRVLSFWGLYWAAAPGYASAGSAFLSALLLQLAFVGQAYIRVAEITAQVSYLKASGLKASGLKAFGLKPVGDKGVPASERAVPLVREEGPPQEPEASESSPTIL